MLYLNHFTQIHVRFWLWDKKALKNVYIFLRFLCLYCAYERYLKTICKSLSAFCLGTQVSCWIVETALLPASSRLHFLSVLSFDPSQELLARKFQYLCCLCKTDIWIANRPFTSLFDKLCESYGKFLMYSIIN